MKRNYVAWYKLKAEIEHKRDAPEFSERDVWWCSIGANIGFEEDGKNVEFERPVFIIRKFSKDLFLGLPLTTKQKEGRFYYPINTGDKNSVVILSQGRALSSKRLLRKIGKVGEADAQMIAQKWGALIIKSDPAKAGSSDANGDLYPHHSKHEQKSQAVKEGSV